MGVTVKIITTTGRSLQKMPASQVLRVKKEVEVPEEDEEGLVTRVREVHVVLWVLLADMVSKALLEFQE